ncbi:MAG: mycofactocin biosynthesis glycosyltransferase MftF, partial [Acidimicrobiia bacterium]
METNRRYTLDAQVWRSHDGRTLIGGSDFTIVALDDNQQMVLNQIVSGSYGYPTGSEAFVRFLSDRNLIQPAPVASGASEVAVVIPCRDQRTELSNLLERLVPEHFTEIVVIDDGSAPPLAISDGSVRVIRHETSLGPGAARNAGWRSTSAEFILFLDADVVTDGRWVSDAVSVLRHSDVAAAAPRVRSIATEGRPGRWEQVRPALDLGAVRGEVRPRTRVPYVPTAALLVRRTALVSVAGFDPSMRLGEDVDLVWRLHDRGWTVRYEPEFEVGHLSRPTVAEWMRQRVTYGRSNVVLADLHPDHVAGIELTWWNTAPLLLLARSWILKTVGIAAATAGVLVLRKRLTDRSEHPWD